MNFMEYVCRGIVRSEDGICRLNKKVAKLAKCTRSTNAGVICMGVAGVLMWSVIVLQDQEIKALKKQVSTIATKMEEQNQQEGA